MKKNSDVNVMLKEAGILFAITLIAGLILGFVYELTKEPIRIQEEKAVQEACAQVFESAAQFAELPYEASEEMALELAETGVEIGTVFQALGADGSLMGYVVQSTSTEGYGGDIVLYLGVTLDGTLNGISLLEISETPGLGMRAQEVLAPQFRGKQVSQFTYTKTGGSSDSEIDAISGATITTEAVTNAVNGGLKVAEALRQGGTDNE
ncbi:MAG TPA: RnfABCDGE type electron transport complex subunit G [Candidatus Acetatifactor stercoripullorum]|uniref:Ion-translocating oxidoreductase complex subunit G n=1 Tax=Candidatus Acetatifactor stercoripullorum TaxID=2838414 RepID=A0A9D1R965_9FIRM|nr:RnfABCDGE type electron transport complex subunit G [uncultured Acetatifactor sp.]HIW82286.1 RnfABCDGE type electron transport complex subunit G [Candidatus Acetatifactor stercoripullorum]